MEDENLRFPAEKRLLLQPILDFLPDVGIGAMSRSQTFQAVPKLRRKVVTKLAESICFAEEEHGRRRGIHIHSGDASRNSFKNAFRFGLQTLLIAIPFAAADAGA